MNLRPYNPPRRIVPRRSSSAQTHQAFAFSAPLKGVDVSQPLPGGNPLTAIRMDNLIPRVLGCQLRRGYERWMSNLGSPVRSLMSYHAADGTPQLFAACDDGNVYDVTVAQPSSFTPVPVLTVTGSTAPGDWCSLNFTTAAGDHLMVAVNQGGGYFTYDGTAWTEIVPGTGPLQIDGVDPKKFTFAMVYKSRLWFIEANSTKAWYLDPSAIAGAATAFDFGAMLPNGGNVTGLINWTFDGSSGVGINNQLVIIADQGDVLVYSGEDPDTLTDFKVNGRWFVGRVPFGHRYFSQYNTDVAILSERGLVFLSELMRGQGFFMNPETTANIQSELALQVAQTLDGLYWEVRFLPHEQLIIINLPESSKSAFIDRQWAYEVNNKAFGGLKGIPMACVETHDGRSFSGDILGNVWWIFQGESDGKVDLVAGKDLEATVVSAFQGMGEGFTVKRFLMVRTSFIARSAPAVQVQLNSEWNLSTPTGAPAFVNDQFNLWDTGIWDRANWAGAAQSFEAWTGANGSGRYASLSLKLRGAADTIFIGWHALVEAGGIL